jgi:hypothetical protein
MLIGDSIANFRYFDHQLRMMGALDVKSKDIFKGCPVCPKVSNIMCENVC